MSPDLPITPGLDEFLELAAERRVIGVRARSLADDPAPIGLYHRLCGNRSGTFLLESAEQGVWSRWSFIGVNCAARLVGAGGRIRWEGHPMAGLPIAGTAPRGGRSKGGSPIGARPAGLGRWPMPAACSA